VANEVVPFLIITLEQQVLNYISCTPSRLAWWAPSDRQHMRDRAGAVSVALGKMEEWLTSTSLSDAGGVPGWVDALLLILDQAMKVQHPPKPAEAPKVRLFALFSLSPFASFLRPTPSRQSCKESPLVSTFMLNPLASSKMPPPPFPPEIQQIISVMGSKQRECC